MKKIPTIYVRDWEGTVGPPGRFLLPEPHPDCGWVFAGEGVATRKLDGTCVLVAGGRLFKRHEVKPDKRTGKMGAEPEGFVEVEHDGELGTSIGWVPVGDGPEDRRHREAFVAELEEHGSLADGTYELIGPKVNGNPEKIRVHCLIPHRDAERLGAVPRLQLVEARRLRGRDVEGACRRRGDARRSLSP